MKSLLKLTLVVVATFVATNLFAQEDPTKQTVIVEPFTYSASVSSTARDNVRSAVLTGLAKVNRFYAVDALTDSRLSSLFAERSYEDVVTESNWQTESTTVYKSLNAERLLKGQVEMVSLYKKYNDEGKPIYWCDLNFTLQLFDITNGTLIGSKSYKYSELSVSTNDDAFNNCINKISGYHNGIMEVKPDVLQFCNEYFKVNTYILELGEADKKGNITELWISGGTEMGFLKGSIFAVYKEKKVGPKVVREKIAEITAEEVLDGVTRCKVGKKEAPIIQQEFNAETKLFIELDRQRGDGFNNIMGGLLG